MKGCIEIIDSPDRENVKITVEKIAQDDSLEDAFSWLLKDFESQGGLLERHIIFCKSIRDCGRIYTMLSHNMPPGFNQHFNMYHSMTSDSVKAAIRTDMNNLNGNIRILVATNAAGMGINFVGVNNVVNYGPPADMDTYLQQMGRAGRCGNQGQAILIYYPAQMRNLDSDMLGYMRNHDCRRTFILGCYNAEISESSAIHTCCDICTIDCHCDLNRDGSCPMLTHRAVEELIETSDSDASMETVLYCDVSPTERTELKKELMKYKATLDSLDGETQIVLDTLSNICIVEIVTKCHNLFTIDDILSLTSVPTLFIASSVLDIMRGIFDNIEDQDDSEYMNDDDR